MKLERLSGLSEQEINGHLERSHVEREVGGASDAANERKWMKKNKLQTLRKGGNGK